MNTLVNTSTLPAEKRNPLATFERPQFRFEQNKWSTTRDLNIEEIAHHWEKSPNLVRVLTDRKLGPNSLVMVRKDTFEKMLKVLEDLVQGEAVVRTNMAVVFRIMKTVEKLIEPEAAKDSALYHAVHSLSEAFGTMSTVIEFSSPKRKMRPSKRSAKEEEELRKIEAEDKK